MNNTVIFSTGTDSWTQDRLIQTLSLSMEHISGVPPPLRRKEGSGDTQYTFLFQIANFTTAFFKASYSQRNNGQHYWPHAQWHWVDQSFSMTFCCCTWLINLTESILSTCNWYLTTYTCDLFTASTCPITNYTFLWKRKVYRVSLDPSSLQRGSNARLGTHYDTMHDYSHKPLLILSLCRHYLKLQSLQQCMCVVHGAQAAVSWLTPSTHLLSWYHKIY